MVINSKQLELKKLELKQYISVDKEKKLEISQTIGTSKKKKSVDKERKL